MVSPKRPAEDRIYCNIRPGSLHCTRRPTTGTPLPTGKTRTCMRAESGDGAYRPLLHARKGTACGRCPLGELLRQRGRILRPCQRETMGGDLAQCQPEAPAPAGFPRSPCEQRCRDPREGIGDGIADEAAAPSGRTQRRTQARGNAAIVAKADPVGGLALRTVAGDRDPHQSGRRRDHAPRVDAELRQGPGTRSFDDDVGRSNA